MYSRLKSNTDIHSNISRYSPHRGWIDGTDPKTTAITFRPMTVMITRSQWRPAVSPGLAVSKISQMRFRYPAPSFSPGRRVVFVRPPEYIWNGMT